MGTGVLWHQGLPLDVFARRRIVEVVERYKGRRPLLRVVIGHAGQVIRDVADFPAKEEGHGRRRRLDAVPLELLVHFAMNLGYWMRGHRYLGAQDTGGN